EGYFDLRHASRCRRYAVQIETPEALVVGRHRALALHDMYLDRGLVIGCRRKDLRTGGRDRRVALDQLRRNATHGLDTERERNDIEEQDIFHVTPQNTALDRRADCDDLVGIDRHVWL